MVGVAMDDDDGYLGVGEKIILFIKGREREREKRRRRKRVENVEVWSVVIETYSRHH